MGKLIFTVNLQLKLFRITVANADIGSLKFLIRSIEKKLYHMLVKFEQNCMDETTQKYVYRKF